MMVCVGSTPEKISGPLEALSFFPGQLVGSPGQRMDWESWDVSGLVRLHGTLCLDAEPLRL